LQRRRRGAAVRIAFAQRELHHLIVETALHAVPLRQKPAAAEMRCEQPERLGGSFDRIRCGRRVQRSRR
jgi:hypothetical protein